MVQDTRYKIDISCILNTDFAVDKKSYSTLSYLVVRIKRKKKKKKKKEPGEFDQCVGSIWT